MFCNTSGSSFYEAYVRYDDRVTLDNLLDELNQLFAQVADSEMFDKG